MPQLHTTQLQKRMSLQSWHAAQHAAAHLHEPRIVVALARGRPACARGMEVLAQPRVAHVGRLGPVGEPFGVKWLGVDPDRGRPLHASHHWAACVHGGGVLLARGRQAVEHDRRACSMGLLRPFTQLQESACKAAYSGPWQVACFCLHCRKSSLGNAHTALSGA